MTIDYFKLHDGLSDMIEDGRLTREMIPDDYDWLVQTLAGGAEQEPPEGACTNPAGHKWNRSAAEADEARISGDYANDNIRCIYCGADGDA